MSEHASTTNDTTEGTSATSSGLSVAAMPREFLYNGQKLPDPDPSLSTERVKAMYAATYPEMATAVIEGPTLKEGKMQYDVRRQVGVKG